jgi:hypothetical protein
VTLLGSEAVRFAYEKWEKAREIRSIKKGKPGSVVVFVFFFFIHFALTISFLTVAILYSFCVLKKGETNFFD